MRIWKLQYIYDPLFLLENRDTNEKFIVDYDRFCQIMTDYSKKNNKIALKDYDFWEDWLLNDFLPYCEFNGKDKREWGFAYFESWSLTKLSA